MREIGNLQKQEHQKEILLTKHQLSVGKHIKPHQNVEEKPNRIGILQVSKTVHLEVPEEDRLTAGSIRPPRARRKGKKLSEKEERAQRKGETKCEGSLLPTIDIKRENHHSKKNKDSNKVTIKNISSKKDSLQILA